MKATYIRGDFELTELLDLVTKVLKAGVPKVVVIHRGMKDKVIGRFEVTAGPPLKIEYFPETAEGEKFSYKFSQMLREHPITGMTVVDVD